MQIITWNTSLISIYNKKIGYYINSMSSNIILMILIFIILAIVLYFFYQNIRSCKSTENYKKTKSMKNKSKNIKAQKTKKK
ncbi:hypothetical protein LBA_00617 [Megavirus lba]|uniref:Uncharacterized protein n=1 Tax=Megavirus lba TaxID=1235314 RepID=L7XYM4_9VIRU|nr:hypothetical protein LBA_00617 [Megavirus lba]